MVQLLSRLRNGAHGHDSIIYYLMQEGNAREKNLICVNLFCFCACVVAVSASEHIDFVHLLCVLSANVMQIVLKSIVFFD